MAATERVTMNYPTPDLPRSALESGSHAGLRISIRTTTSSLSDYPEWNLEELRSYRKDAVVTDGSCS